MNSKEFQYHPKTMLLKAYSNLIIAVLIFTCTGNLEIANSAERLVIQESNLGYVNSETLKVAEEILRTKLAERPERIFYYYPEPDVMGHQEVLLKIRISQVEYKRILLQLSMKEYPLSLWIHSSLPKRLWWWKIPLRFKEKIFYITNGGVIDRYSTYINGEMYFLRYTLFEDHG